MRIQILTHFDEKFRPVADLTFPKLKSYCQRHGYFGGALETRTSDRHPVWDKIQLIRGCLSEADWTMYMDADAMITNSSIKLEDIIDDKYDMIIANDVNGLNSGVFLMKNTQWSQDFLDKVWDIDRNHPIYHRGNKWDQTEGEQNAMKAVIAEDPDSKNHIWYIDQKRINAYLYHVYNYPEDHWGAWKPGDFILHLPGMQNHERVKIFQEKLSQVQ